MTTHDDTVGSVIGADIDFIHQRTTAAAFRFGLATRPLSKRLALRKDTRKGIANIISFGIFQGHNPNRHSVNYRDGIHHTNQLPQRHHVIGG